MQACGILVSSQGWNLYPLHWKHRVLTNGSPGKSLGLRSILSWFLYIVLGESPISFFYMWMSIFFQHHLLKRVSFPHWTVLALLSKIIWHICESFWAFCSVPLFCMSVFMPVPHSFACWRFVIKSEIRKGEPSQFCSFSRLFWLFGGPLRFSIGLHWICRSLWEVLTF